MTDAQSANIHPPGARQLCRHTGSPNNPQQPPNYHQQLTQNCPKTDPKRTKGAFDQRSPVFQNDATEMAPKTYQNDAPGALFACVRAKTRLSFEYPASHGFLTGHHSANILPPVGGQLVHREGTSKRPQNNPRQPQNTT